MSFDPHNRTVENNELIINTTKKATASLMQVQTCSGTGTQNDVWCHAKHTLYLTDTTDIILFLRGEAANGAARLQAYGSLTLETIENHTTINKQFMADLNIPPRAMRDLTIPTMMLGRHFTVTTPGTDNTAYRDSLQNIIDNITSETITCYTDGSRTVSGSGAGYIITTYNNNTILEEACKYLSTYTHTHIIILWSESLSSIQAISSLSTRSRTARDCCLL